MTEKLKTRRRGDYPFVLDYRTRWTDNDMYAHMNNGIYNQLFDAAINTYLINHCGLNPSTSAQHGLIVHSHIDFFRPISFPATVEVGLKVKKMGRSSVTYEVAMFEASDPSVKAVGEYVHVFVEDGRPVELNAALKNGLDHLRSKL